MGTFTGKGRRAVAVATAAVLALALLRTDLGSAGAQTATQPPSVVVPVTPFRILDTRSGAGTGGIASPVGPDSTITLQVAGVGTVPAEATGVVINLTVTGGTDPGWITAYPTGSPRPNASVGNITPGQDLPNMITVSLGDGGRLDLYNFTGSVHLVADVSAYLIPATGGSPGPQGPQGPQGPAGVTRVITGSATGGNGGTALGSNSYATVVGTLPLPAGTYYVSADARVGGPSTNNFWAVSCRLQVGGKSVTMHVGEQNEGYFRIRTISLQVPVTLAADGSAVVGCNDSQSQPGVWHEVRITATQVHELIEVPLS